MKATKTSALIGAVALALFAVGPNLYAGVSFEGGISVVEEHLSALSSNRLWREGNGFLFAT